MYENSLVVNNINKLIRYKKPAAIFSWQLFYNCNYNCKYCFEKKLDKFNFSIDELLKTSENVYKYYKKYGFELLSIIGGEATLLEIDDFLSLFSHFIYETNLNFEIITNFYRPISYFEKICAFFSNLKRVTIKVSYHEEYNSIRKFFKKFEELIKMSLKYNNVVPKIEFVITEETKEKDIEEVYLLFTFLKNKYKNKNKHIELHLAEEFRYDKGWNLVYLYDSSKLAKKHPEYIKHLTQRRKYIVKKEDVTFEGYSSDFLKSESKILHTKGCKCTQNEMFLEDNKLKNFCDRNIITDDFMNCDVEKLKINFTNICKNDICTETFVSVEK